MQIIPLKITWKLIRRAGYGRTKDTYCTYIAEDKDHKHRLKTIEGTKLFDLLQSIKIGRDKDHPERFEKSVFVDGVYYNNKLLCIKNPRIL